jgi:hypothetical protein
VDTFAEVLAENAKRSLLMFTNYGDSSTHFGFEKPIVDPVTAFFLLIGVLIACVQIRKRWALMLLMWLFGTLVLGSVISNDPPFWPHLIVLLVPVAVLAAIAMRMLITLSTRWGDYRVPTSMAIAVAIALIGFRNWELYSAFVQNNARPAARIGRIIERTDPAFEIVLIADPISTAVREIAFPAANRRVVDEPPGTVLDPTTPPRHRAIYVVTPNHAGVVDALRARHRSATVVAYSSPSGELIVTTVSVDEPIGEGR